jgi:hypothetical protein
MDKPTRRVTMNKGQFRRILSTHVSDVFRVLWSPSRPGTLAVLAALVFWAVFAVSAKASCGLATSPTLGGALPESPLLEAEAAMQDSSETDQESETGNNHATLVGFWKVRFSSHGQLVFVAFDQWHSEGTEILNDGGSPGVPNGTGGVCLGVYKKTGPRTYKSTHPYWVYDDKGNRAGSGVILEKITVGTSGNRYSGSFSNLRYDLDGKLVSRLDGGLAATRITP